MRAATALCLLLAVLCADASRSRHNSRQRAPLLGGWRSIDVTSPEAQEAARKATVHLEQSKNSLRTYRLQRLVSAKSQVVAGTNYRLQLVIEQTDCNRGQNANPASCQAVKSQRCTVTIHVPLQSETSQLMNQKCDRERPIRNKTTTVRVPMPGGPMEIDVNGEEVRQAASFATQQLTSQSNGRLNIQHQRIVKATSQVVSGIMYELTMEVTLTESGSNQIRSTSCKVKVWDQAWRNPRYMLQQHQCDQFIA